QLDSFEVVAVGDRPITKPLHRLRRGPVPFTQVFNWLRAGRAFETIDAGIADGIDAGKIEDSHSATATVLDDRPNNWVRSKQLPALLIGRPQEARRFCSCN